MFDSFFLGGEGTMGRYTQSGCFVAVGGILFCFERKKR